jgi:energy-converting hydrogenase Eha subunit E
MTPDGLDGFESILGAFSGLSKRNDDGETSLADARCPTCKASDFIAASDLYLDAIRRVEISGTASTPGPGGMTDREILGRFSPPTRRSPIVRALLVALPLAAGSFLIFRHFGTNAGELAAMASIVVVSAVLLTTARRLSDQYYERRGLWNRLYVCRQCGQPVRTGAGH